MIPSWRVIQLVSPWLTIPHLGLVTSTNSSTHSEFETFETSTCAYLRSRAGGEFGESCGRRSAQWRQDLDGFGWIWRFHYVSLVHLWGVNWVNAWMQARHACRKLIYLYLSSNQQGLSKFEASAEMRCGTTIASFFSSDLAIQCSWQEWWFDHICYRLSWFNL